MSGRGVFLRLSRSDSALSMGAWVLVVSSIAVVARVLAWLIASSDAARLPTGTRRVGEDDAAPSGPERDVDNPTHDSRTSTRERAILSAMRAPILITSADGVISYFNRAAAAIFGDSAHLSGRSVQLLLPFINTSPSDGQTRTWVGRFDDASGHTLDVEVTETRLRDDAHGTNLYVLHDISQHAELNRLREQLLHSVAHELRTPMTVLENTLDIAATSFATMTVREFDEFMKSARRTTMRLRSLMDDLLSAGNIQSGQFLINARPIELRTIVESALEYVDALVQERHQHVLTHVPAKGVTVLADRRYVRQILTNLLANASKYSPHRSTISITAEHLTRQVKVTIEDQGGGIPPDQQAGLFERFYRVRAWNEEPGIGLGLAIVKGIVVAHGGRVGIDSDVGAGTRVWFTLPTHAE